MESDLLLLVTALNNSPTRNFKHSDMYIIVRPYGHFSLAGNTYNSFAQERVRERVKASGSKVPEK